LVKTIPLTQGEVALVDDEDYERVMTAGPWYAQRAPGTFYARHGERQGRRIVQVSLHRFLLKAASGQLIDHINQNGLDNRRTNLRLCSPSQNIANQTHRAKKVASASRFKGVTWNKRDHIWQAQIGFQNKHLYLGSFQSEEEAARAYDKAALGAWGEFSVLNLPVRS
jgi:hypothetical protein